MMTSPGGCKVAVEMEIQKRQLVAKDKELEMARANLNIQKANEVRRPPQTAPTADPIYISA